MAADKNISNENSEVPHFKEKYWKSIFSLVQCPDSTTNCERNIANKIVKF